MKSSRLALFMVVFGTPITLLLLTTYLPLAEQKRNSIVFFSCLIECLSTGIYCGSLIGMLFSTVFKFDLGTNWREITLIRITSSGPILFMHPFALCFVDWLSFPSLMMTAAWLVAMVDVIQHRNALAESDSPGAESEDDL